jgi:acetate kinase
VLALNCGSSSVKLALIDPVTGERSLTALAERVGSESATVSVRRGGLASISSPDDSSHRGVVEHLVEDLRDSERDSLVGVGHRVVHGGPDFRESVVVDDLVVRRIAAVSELAPLQVPGNLAGIDAARAALGHLPSVAVFDTAFHATLPPIAYRYAVPAAWYDVHGVRRYGFHGISHRYISARAAELMGVPLADLRLVTLHLGNGCSAAAIKGGVSVDTTMGLTPLEGLVMGTRSGDIDAGALGYVGPRLGLDLVELVAELNRSSGLLGLSGLSNDMRTLTDAAREGSEEAQLAIDVFCFRAAKAVGALTVSLGGLDAVVLAGGIGEHSADVRAGILGHLGGFGLELDPVANADHGSTTGGRISRSERPVALVVPTDEELVIARDTAALAAAR